MKARCAFSSIAFLLLCCGSLRAQSAMPPTDLISVQPTIHVNNMVPTEVVGFSVQYERVISVGNAVLATAMWFRDPFLKQAIFGVAGVGLSGEFRYYFAAGSSGWHLGPFAEWIMFKLLGTYSVVHGSEIKSAFDIGAVGGHKWISGRVSFDLSLRASWYSPNDYPNGRFFPSRDSQFNSHLIVSIGYGFN